jgi:hypothetical protein
MWWQQILAKWRLCLSAYVVLVEFDGAIHFVMRHLSLAGRKTQLQSKCNCHLCVKTHLQSKCSCHLYAKSLTFTSFWRHNNRSDLHMTKMWYRVLFSSSLPIVSRKSSPTMIQAHIDWLLQHNKVCADTLHMFLTNFCYNCSNLAPHNFSFAFTLDSLTQDGDWK